MALLPNTRLLMALSDSIQNSIPCLARASLVTVCWMSSAIQSKDIQIKACSILAPKLMDCLNDNAAFEDKILASLAFHSLTKGTGMHIGQKITKILCICSYCMLLLIRSSFVAIAAGEGRRQEPSQALQSDMGGQGANFSDQFQFTGASRLFFRPICCSFTSMMTVYFLNLSILYRTAIFWA